MARRSMIMLSRTLVVAGLLAGCSLQASPVAVKASTAPAGTGTTPTDPKNEPLEPLAGVTFLPITAATSKFLSANGSNIVSQGGGNIGGGSASLATTGAVSTSAAIAPMAAGVSNSSAGGAVSDAGGIVTKDGSAPSSSAAAPGGEYSGNVYSYYGYDDYFNGFGGYGGSQQMALVSLQQAQLKGDANGFTDIVSNVAGPLIKSWAADARLVRSNAVLNNNGTLVTAPSSQPSLSPLDLSYGYQYGWTLTYASNSRNEILTFVVTAAQTNVLRMRWEPLNLDPTLVTTDSNTALQKIVTAIQDKTFKGAEETSGKDYFLGFGFIQPTTGEYDGSTQKTTVLYQVPSTAHWTIDLEEIMGKLVWNANFNNYDGGGVYYGSSGGGIAVPLAAEAAPAAVGPIANRKLLDEPCATPSWSGYDNDYGGGMVDAETGTVIRFQRPVHVDYQTYYGDVKCVEPSIYPATPTPPSPSATPTATPTATPDATATSSATQNGS